MNPLNKRVSTRSRILIYYYQHIIPSLYFISMWVCLTAGAFILIGDLEQAAGAVSAFSLFYLLLSRRNLELEQMKSASIQKYLEEMYGNAKSAEKKGE